MKTILEQQFDRAVITKLCKKEMSAADRAHALLDFHNNSETYYGNLCDALFAVSTRQNNFPIWMTPTGDSYLSLRTKSPEDFVLLYPDEVPGFDFDIVDQLEVAILKI